MNFKFKQKKHGWSHTYNHLLLDTVLVMKKEIQIPCNPQNPETHTLHVETESQ